MKRKDFYSDYYTRTNRLFSDKIIWTKEDRENAWRKGQLPISKSERKLFITTQYLTLLLCWIPVCFYNISWAIILIALLAFLLQSCISDFSIIKIECLYLIYRKDNIFCFILHSIFLGNSTSFFNELKRATNKKISGYVLKGGGEFYAKYLAVCRNKNDKIILVFQKNKIKVSINKKITVIKNKDLSQEQLLSDISSIINRAD